MQLGRGILKQFPVAPRSSNSATVSRGLHKFRLSWSLTRKYREPIILEYSLKKFSLFPARETLQWSRWIAHWLGVWGLGNLRYRPKERPGLISVFSLHYVQSRGVSCLSLRPAAPPALLAQWSFSIAVFSGFWGSFFPFALPVLPQPCLVPWMLLR